MLPRCGGMTEMVVVGELYDDVNAISRQGADKIGKKVFPADDEGNLEIPFREDISRTVSGQGVKGPMNDPWRPLNVGLAGQIFGKRNEQSFPVWRGKGSIGHDEVGRIIGSRGELDRMGAGIIGSCEFFIFRGA